MPAMIHTKASSRKRRKEVRNFKMAMNYRWQYTKTRRDIKMQTERIEGTTRRPCKKASKRTASHGGHRGQQLIWKLGGELVETAGEKTNQSKGANVKCIVAFSSIFRCSVYWLFR
jgi:hypothetical protein